MIVSHRRSPARKLLDKPLILLTHLRIAKVHLAEEMISQTAIIIKAGEIRAADVADLQFLMSRRSRGILKQLELSLQLLLLRPDRAQVVEILRSPLDTALLGENLNLQQAGLDATSSFADAAQKVIRLSHFLRGLLQPALRRVDSPITIGDVSVNVIPIVEVEAPLPLLLVGRVLVFLPEIR